MKNKKTRFYATICIGLVFVFSIIPLLVLAQYKQRCTRGTNKIKKKR